nr:PhM00064.1 [Neoporphyra haitanensis]
MGMGYILATWPRITARRFDAVLARTLVGAQPSGARTQGLHAVAEKVLAERARDLSRCRRLVLAACIGDAVGSLLLAARGHLPTRAVQLGVHEALKALLLASGVGAAASRAVRGWWRTRRGPRQGGRCRGGGVPAAVPSRLPLPPLPPLSLPRPPLPSLAGTAAAAVDLVAAARGGGSAAVSRGGRRGAAARGPPRPAAAAAAATAAAARAAAARRRRRWWRRRRRRR